MRKPKPFVPNEQNYQNFLLWVEEMKKINTLPKGNVFYEAILNKRFVDDTFVDDGLRMVDNLNPSLNHYITPVFCVSVVCKYESNTDVQLSFYFGKLTGAIDVWQLIDDDSDEDFYNDIWQPFWKEKYPNEDQTSKFTTTKLWEILTQFIQWEQAYAPIH